MDTHRFHDSFWTNIFARSTDEQKTIVEVLRKLPLFCDFKDGQLREFERIMHRRSFKAEETIFWEGEPGVGMYIIHEGRVGIYKRINDNEREQLAELKKGDFFGEVALLDESPRSATAVALEDTRILGLFRPDLVELAERKPRLGTLFFFQLARVLGERLRGMNQELQELRVELLELNRRLQPESTERSEMIV
jgi:CRP-like cAMP-binding protein